MKAEERAHEETLRGTLRLRMAACGTLAKPSGRPSARRLLLPSPQTHKQGTSIFKQQKKESGSVMVSEGNREPAPLIIP